MKSPRHSTPRPTRRRGSTHLVEAHTALVDAILLDLGSLPDVLIEKRTTGAGRAMDSERVIHFGLYGAGDVFATVGPHGRYLELEAKTGGARQQENQRNRQRAVEAVGGVYALCRTVEDARAALARAREPIRAPVGAP